MRVIGLISGTSADGIDAALVEISGVGRQLQIDLLAGETYPYPAELRSQILALSAGAAIEISELAALDDTIALEFAQAAKQIIQKIPDSQATAELIGSHGQTVYHRPPQPIVDNRFSQNVGAKSVSTTVHSTPLGYSLQLGRGAVIAQATGIPTVSNFRAADLAVGGHGAPLVPMVDACLLSHPEYSRCVQNLGGIGNVTYLPANCAHQLEFGGLGILGWDTGPGNTLLDLAVYQLSNSAQTYDHGGQWAAQGQPCQALVQEWLQQDFFQQSPPKSTGREYFGQHYLARCLTDAEVYQLTPADILATLTELTVASIVRSYEQFLPQRPEQVLLCGGGSHNLYLRQRLQMLLHPTPVMTTADVNLDVDFKEAIAFAVLAYWRHHEWSGNLLQVTGAKKAVLLGEYQSQIV
ncbi:MAG: anhydro-N-acetylmuramic acid kinase [Microcoleaceae cyanobacterium]